MKELVGMGKESGTTIVVAFGREEG